MDLRAHLAILKEAGVSKARATWNGGELASLDVEFEPPQLSGAAFVDKDGKPIDLGEDLPDLAHDPIAAKYPGGRSS